MVGQAIMRALVNKDQINVITRTRQELDLIDQASVRDFFRQEKPDQVFLCAAKVGGIHANNTYPANFIYENLMIESNIIDAAFRSGTKKLLFLGSSCIYPKLSHQPIAEGTLLTGSLEPTNEPYAISKIAGIKLCESYNRQYGDTHEIDYRSVMPCNLYGPGDNYHHENAHVIPSLIRRFHQAKIDNCSEVKILGTGIAKREFLYVDDLATACLEVMNLPKCEYKKLIRSMQSHINVGSGSEITIKQLATLIMQIIEYQGIIDFDKSKPDGTLNKLLDSSLMKSIGWKPKISLESGLKITYEYFQKSILA